MIADSVTRRYAVFDRIASDQTFPYTANMSNNTRADLRTAYDHRAEHRDTILIPPWMEAERANFLQMLQQEQKQTLLEIGAGPGRDSLFFQQQGLDVVATDLSAEHVRLCREKGLTANVVDFTNMPFDDASFDAVFALNCLLHIPKCDLPDALRSIDRVLARDGLFFMGVHGGRDQEGIFEDDKYRPKRFFSFYTDEQIQQIVSKQFDLLQFKRIATGDDSGLHFQSMFLRKRSAT
jgi:SAM-dependent methyltransferase